jgi:hypothetical protein
MDTDGRPPADATHPGGPGRRRAALGAFLLILGAGVGACSGGPLIESHNVGPGLQGPLRGISYYLPKKLLKVEVWHYVKRVPRRDAAGAPVLDENGREVQDAASVYFAVFPDHNQDGGERVVPDLRHQFVIMPRWDPASHDELSVKVSPEGLLEEVKGTATDERGTLASELTALFSMMVTGIPITPSPKRGLTDTEGVPRFIAEFQFDPIDPAERARVEGALRRYGIAFSLTKQADCPTAASGAGCCTTCDLTQPGIYYRLPIPYRLNLSPAGIFRASGDRGSQGEWESLDGGLERTVLLPNEAVCIYVPVTRAAFVKSETTVLFERGMLKEVTTTKPSELVGFVRIPVDVASAILAIPSELLTLRIKHIEGERSRSAAEKELLELERDRLQAQIDVLEKAAELQKKSKPEPSTTGD